MRGRCNIGELFEVPKLQTLWESGEHGKRLLKAAPNDALHDSGKDHDFCLHDQPKIMFKTIPYRDFGYAYCFLKNR